MRRGLALATMLLAMLLNALPVAAGGSATVRLDNPPGEVVVEVPWSFGFMVKQHDVTPTNDVKVRVDARHRETGESVTAEARQAGEVGHFVAEVTFPRSGAWKWSITPAPFAPTSFETLTVLEAPGSAKLATDPNDTTPNHPAHVHTGSCAALGDIAFPLTNVGAGTVADGTPVATSGAIGAASAVPVAISSTTIDAGLAELTTGNYAINVHKSEENIDTYVACGDIGGPMIGGDLVVGLQQLNNSGDVGVAVLRPEGDSRTTVSLFMIVVEDQSASATPEAAAAVQIVAAGDNWGFAPPLVEIPVGGTVTWTNQTGEAHTVTGDDLAFADSGPLDQGDSFSQTFTVAGTYLYHCGPHPWMLGTVVVR